MRYLPILLLAACDDPYLFVSVEGSDLALTVAPAEVSVGVYADDQRIDFDFTARLQPRVEGGVPATDFVLLTEDMPAEAQLRIVIPTARTTFFADARISGEGELRLPLFAGERLVTNANLLGGDLETSVLFGSGIVMGYVDAGGVQARIEPDPDNLISRGDVIVPDAGAGNLRLASRPNALGYPPDLYAIAWLGGDGQARMRVTTITEQHPVRDLGVAADDIALGAAFTGDTFATAVAARIGDAVRLQTFDESGLPTASALGAGVPIATGATTLVGVAVTRDGIVVGWRANDGSHVTLFDATDGALRADTALAGDLVSLALTNDGSRLLTLQRRGLELAQVSYFPSLEPTDVDVVLGTTIVGSRTALSGCIAAWPEVRADGSNVTDLRFAVLDADGRIVGEPHLLNVEEAGDHIAPTAVCASQTRAYATFFERAGPSDPSARLRLRRIPTY